MHALLRTIYAIILALAALPATAQDPAAPATNAPAEQSAPAESEPIGLSSPDRDIERRLTALFGELEGLENIRADVDEGVVTLTGSTLTIEGRQRAENIASRLAGVVSVQNEVAAEYRVGRRLQPMVAKAREMITSIIAFLPLLLVALVIFLAIVLLGRLFTRSTGLFRRIAPNPFIEALIRQVVRLIFLLLALVAAMSVLGATAMLGSLLGAAGVLGLAVGFAVRDTIENYIASILLSIRQPFAPNDHVIIEGFEGRITRLNSRATVITTFDGNEVRIPNAIVYKAMITNFTRTPERRFEFEAGVGYENDLTCALAIAVRATKGVPGVLADPLPFAQADRLDAYTVVLKVFGWVDQNRSDFMKVKSEAIRAVKEAYEAEGISMPEPIQNVRHLPDAPATSQETPETQSHEVQAVKDTSADPTIKEKVSELRARPDEDLLTHDAPRE